MLVYVYRSEKGIGDDGLPAGTSARTETLDGSDGQVTVDYDADGKVLGVEILDALRVTTEES